MHRQPLRYGDGAEQDHARRLAVNALKPRLAGLQESHRPDQVELEILPEVGGLQAAERPQRDRSRAVDGARNLIGEFRQRAIDGAEIAGGMPDDTPRLEVSRLA